MNRRIAVPAAIVAAALVLLLGLALGRLSVPRTQEPAAPPPLPVPSTTTGLASASPTPAPEPTDEGIDPDAGDASPGATPYSQTAAARRQWEPVVTGFAKAFVKTDVKSDRAWAAGLKPYTTAAVQKQLGYTDRRNVPTGHYQEYEVAEHGDDKLSAIVSYREGWGMVLYVISEGDGWRVYQYDQYQE